MDGDYVMASRGYSIYRLSTMLDVRHPVSDWYDSLDGLGSGTGTLNPSVVAGSTVWFHSPDNSVVHVLHKTTHEKLFVAKMKREGAYQLASDGNRVFIARGGRIYAMPVYGRW